MIETINIITINPREAAMVSTAGMRKNEQGGGGVFFELG